MKMILTKKSHWRRSQQKTEMKMIFRMIMIVKIIVKMMILKMIQVMMIIINNNKMSTLMKMKVIFMKIIQGMIIITKSICKNKIQIETQKIYEYYLILALDKHNVNFLHGHHFQRKIIKFISKNILIFNRQIHQFIADNTDIPKSDKRK